MSEIVEIPKKRNPRVKKIKEENKNHESEHFSVPNVVVPVVPKTESPPQEVIPRGKEETIRDKINKFVVDVFCNHESFKKLIDFERAKEYEIKNNFNNEIRSVLTQAKEAQVYKNETELRLLIKRIEKEIDKGLEGLPQ